MLPLRLNNHSSAAIKPEMNPTYEKLFQSSNLQGEAAENNVNIAGEHLRVSQ